MITLNIKGIKESLASKLEGRLASDGYVYSKSNNWFVKANGGFEYLIFLLLHKRSDHHAIEIFLFIRQVQVEKILKQIIGSTTGITMGNTIGIIYNSPDRKKVINNLMEILLYENRDIEAAIETVGQYYDTIAKRFFEEYSSLENIHDIINNPPFDYNPAYVGGMFDERCMRGLIIARLIESSNYEQLVTIYDDAIEMTTNVESIENYNKVKDYLTQNNLK